MPTEKTVSVAAPAPAAVEVAPETPVVEQAPPAEDLTIEQEIAQFNKQVEESEIEDPDEDEEEATPEEAPAVADEPKPDTKPADAPVVEAEFKFSPEMTADEFKAEKEKFFETYEKTPELDGLVTYYESQLEKAATATASPEMSEFGTKLVEAASKIYETEEKDGEIIYNAKPLVETLRTDLKKEFPNIVDEVFASDSLKYQGMTTFEEKLVDEFGVEKVSAAVAFLKANTPLPTVPLAGQAPAAIGEQIQEAYWQLPEYKRFEVEGLIKDIAQLEKDLADPELADYKSEYQPQLNEAQQKLQTELSLIADRQNTLNTNRQRAETEKRANETTARAFHNEVTDAYQTGMADLTDTFAKDLAPKLSFADTDTQLSHARNITTRIGNALSFFILDDGSFAPDPMAEHYAKQLAEEGIKVDFAKGRELLQKRYVLERKLTLQEKRNDSKPAIDNTKTELRNVVNEFKLEQTSALGQLTAKYIKSSGDALAKKVEDVKEKKQLSRRIERGRGVSKSVDTDIDKDIAAYNKRVAAQIATGEELYESYI
jgi:hypothetical protein